MKEGVVSGYKTHFYSGRRHVPPRNSQLPYYSVETSFLAGQKKRLTYLIEVDEEGLYEIMFRGDLGEEILHLRKKVKAQASKQLLAVKDYVLVGVGPNNGFQSTVNIPRFSRHESLTGTE